MPFAGRADGLIAHAPPPLARPGGTGHRPTALADWLWEHHPAFRRSFRRRHILRTGRRGSTRSYRRVRATRPRGAGGDGNAFDESRPAYRERRTRSRRAAAFPQTLLVSRNAEILAYRQGLTPSLIALLTQVCGLDRARPGVHTCPDRTRVYRASKPASVSPKSCTRCKSTGPGPCPGRGRPRPRWGSKRERVAYMPRPRSLNFRPRPTSTPPSSVACVRSA